MEKYQAVARLSPALSVIAAGTEHFVLLVADMLERLLFMVAVSYTHLTLPTIHPV